MEIDENEHYFVNMLQTLELEKIILILFLRVEGLKKDGE